MSLSGNLRTMDLAELLQWVAIGKKTGALVFVRNKTKNTIYFQDGLIVSSSSNEPTYQLGQYLLFQGTISEIQLHKAMELQQKNRQFLSNILVEAGFVSLPQVQKALAARTEEVIFDLFLWEEGQFHFATNGNAMPEDLFRIKISVNSVIFEGVRRKDEWARIRSEFPTNDIVLRLRPGADLKSVTLTALQKKLLYLVSTGKAISEMILEVHGSDFQVNFELFQLYELNLIEPAGVPKNVPETKPAEDPIIRAVRLMDEGRHEEAIHILQDVLRTDPQNFKAHEQIELAEKAICRNLYQTEMPEDKVPHFVVPVGTLAKLQLSHREAYVASRINGTWDIKSIVRLSPLREHEVLQILQKLRSKKLIELR